MDHLRECLANGPIRELLDIHYLNQNDRFNNPCYPVIIHAALHNYNRINSIHDKLSIKDLSELNGDIIYMVYFNGKLAYIVNENSKKINLFLNDLLNKKQINVNKEYYE